MSSFSSAALAALALCSVLASCSDAASREAERRLASMSLEEKAAQVLFIGVEGSGKPSSASLALLEDLRVGGVLLFGFNLSPEPAEAGVFTSQLQDAAERAYLQGESRSDSQREFRRDSPIPLIVAIDHEGGSVFRFKGPGITRLPSPKSVGERGEPNAARYAALLGKAAGSELRSLGITMNLAPVVELLTDENAAFLGTRSYGSSGKEADADAGAFIEGLQSEGVVAVAKHFPGNAAADPHKVLPLLDLSESAYKRDCLPRFSSAIRHRVSAIMISHVLFPAVDPDKPASLSPLVVRGELRGRLGFRGLAITDDLCMRAVSSSISLEKAAVEALVAGEDFLMIVDMRQAARARDAIVKAVDTGLIPASRLDEAVGRILALKTRYAMESELDPEARAKARASFKGKVEKNAAMIEAFESSSRSDSAKPRPLK